MGDRARYGRDVRDAAAAHSDRDTRTRLEMRSKARLAHLTLYGGGDIGQLAIGEILADKEHAGKLHIRIILQ